ncbi:MAG: hypothetical protein WD066_09935 [Planctomycetaceae bacterium]
MNDKVEGTLVLGGLLEGRCANGPAPEEKLREWIEFMRTLGPRFSLDCSGSSFSLLPDDAPASTARLGSAPETAIAQAVEQLLGVLPAEDRGNVFSTLRSAEYRPKEEVQSVYLVAPDGAVKVETRVVDAQTVAPATPVSIRARVRYALLGLAIAALLLGVTAFFVDVPGLLSRLAGVVKPVDMQELAVDAAPFAAHFRIVEKELATDGRYLLLTLERGDRFPRTDAELQQASERAEGVLSDRLAIEALARGYVRCELFDPDGRFFSASTHRIAGLRTEESITLAVPLQSNPKRRLGSVRIGY